MPDKPKSASCCAANRAQAERIIAQLKLANFSSEDITMEFPDRQVFKPVTPEPKRRLGGSTGVVVGVSIGGIVGVIAGWLGGTGTIKIPGGDSLVNAGPSMDALGGVVLGAVVGGVAAWLIGLTLPDDGSGYSHGYVVAGNILITVRTQDTEQFVRAQKVFTKPTDQPLTQSPKT